MYIRLSRFLSSIQFFQHHMIYFLISLFQIKILFRSFNVYIKMRYCLRGTKRFLLTKIYFLCLGLYFPYRSAQKKLRHNSNGWNCVTGKECNQMGRKTFQFCVKPHWNVYDYQSKIWFYAEPCSTETIIHTYNNIYRSSFLCPNFDAYSL